MFLWSKAVHIRIRWNLKSPQRCMNSSYCSCDMSFTYSFLIVLLVLLESDVITSRVRKITRLAILLTLFCLKNYVGCNSFLLLLYVILINVVCFLNELDIHTSRSRRIFLEYYSNYGVFFLIFKANLQNTFFYLLKKDLKGLFLNYASNFY